MIKITTLASGSKGNAYRIDDGRTPLLLEAGIPFKQLQQALDFKLSEIKGCLISHSHLDHCKAVKDVAKAGIDIYLTQHTKDVLGLNSHRLRATIPHQQFSIDSWEIVSFDTQHDTEDSVGYLLANQDGDKLMFATDTFYLRYTFSGLTHIMLEINFDQQTLDQNVRDGIVDSDLRNRIMRSHMSLETAVEFLRANDLSKVQQIYILHLSDTNANEQLIKSTVQKVAGKPVAICG